MAGSRSRRRTLPLLVLAALASAHVRCVGDDPQVPNAKPGLDASLPDSSLPDPARPDATSVDEDGGDGEAPLVDAGEDAGPVPQHASAPLQLAKSAQATSGPLVAVDGGGNTIVAFSFDRPLQILGVNLAVSGGSTDNGLAKISPAGVVVWTKVFGGVENDFVSALAVSQAGEVFLAGSFFGTELRFGPSVVVSYAMAAGRGAPFVARLDATAGEGVAATTFSGTSGAQCSELALTADNALAVGCDAVGNVTLTLDSGASSTLVPPGSSWSPVVARLNPVTLRPLWANRMGSSSNQDRIRGLAIVGNGDVFASLRIGARPLSFTVGSQLTDETRGDAIVRFGANNGTRVGAFEFPTGAAGAVLAGPLVSGGGGNFVHFVGTLTGEVTIGSTTLSSAGDTDIVAGQLGADATSSWVARYGGAGADAPSAITRRDSRTYVVAKHGPGPIEIEGLSLPATDGDSSVLFEATASDNDSRWLRAVRGSAETLSLNPTSVVVDPLANAVIQAGLFRGTLDLGDGVLATTPDTNVHNAFLVRWKK